MRQLFPQARTAVFSSDTAPDARSARALIQRMTDGEIDILVATQAAAKGHNFPRLTLVGVVDADLGLRGGDLRAAERTYQLLAQATGRAGRADRPGRAILQTWTPEHPVLTALAAGDRDAFVEAEMAEREAASLPPYGRLASVMISAQSEDKVERAAAEAEMARLGTLRGEKFDRAWLTMMIEHHQGAVEMAEKEIADGSNDEAVAMARTIVETQNAEISRMQQLLG